MIVKYYGRNTVLVRSDYLITQTLSSVKEVLDISSKNSLSDNSWKGLKEDATHLMNYLLNEKTNAKRYQIEILHEGVLPYIKTMSKNMVLDKDRFSQLQRLFLLLTNADDASTHPAITLIAIDNMIETINIKGAWFKSELANSLERVVEKQWQPIIADNKKALLNWGGKLILAGSIEVIARSFVMLWPIYLIVLDVVQISKSLEVKKNISPESVLKLVKSCLLLFAASKLVEILSMFQGFGYVCVLSGVALVVFSSNDALIKQVSPALSPNIAALDEFVDRLVKFETNLFNNVTASAPSAPSVSSVASAPDTASCFPESSRVEELSDPAPEGEGEVQPLGPSAEIRRRRVSPS